MKVVDKPNRHHIFDVEAWKDMSMFEQMGNIGSEVGRALTAKRQGNPDRAQGAFYRGLDLIDETVAIWASQKSPRTKELLIAREQFAASVTEDTMDETLGKYFMEFAVAARLRRMA